MFKRKVFVVVALAACSQVSVAQSTAPTKRDTVRIIPKAEWKAQEARPYKKHVPVKITVHHEGGKVLAATADAKQRLKNIQTWSMGPDRKWTDVPYHFLIAPDGTVLEGRNPLVVGETNTEYDLTK